MKKTSKILFFICILLTSTTASLEAGESFNSKIETTQDNQEFAFWVDNAQDFEVDWGEEAGDNFVPVDDGSSLLSHEYLSQGEYIVKVKGSAERISFYGDGEGTPELLIDILTPVSDGVEGITSAEEMFRGAINITEFEAENFFDDTSENITNMSGLFWGASSFDGDISNWDVSNVTTMRNLFFGADSFNQDISGWEVESVTDMRNMFREISSFDYDISGWNVSNVTNMSSMFSHFNSFNQDISGWDVSNVETMAFMFRYCEIFDQDIGSWETENVTDMSNTFHGASNFNADIGGWDVSNVISMFGIFQSAESFDQDIGDWEVGSVKTMAMAFDEAESFNQDIGGWDVSSVDGEIVFVAGHGEPGSMREMFNRAYAFNQDISDWDVSNVPDMSGMFRYADSFNQDIGGWEVGNVENMSSMFRDARHFNGDIGSWDVSNVEDMSWMFTEARNFNGNIGSWDVSGVTTMRIMFRGSDAFNQDIGGWDVSNVENMESMFEANTRFNREMTFDQDISDWDVSNVVNFENFLADSKLSTQNYDRLLIGWSELELNDDITFDAGDSRHSLGPPQDSKEHIKTTFNWEINDGGDTGKFYYGTQFTIITDEVNLEFSFKVYEAENLEVSWADGEPFDGPFNGSEIISHTYAEAGEYTLSIRGKANRISFYGDGDGTPRLLDDFLTPISEGISGITSAEEMFRGAENIETFTAENFFDDISGNVTNMSKMLKGASSFNGDISGWNVSGVTDMSEMFKNAHSFNTDISGWDVSGATTMKEMFMNAGSFNRDISDWDVSSVENFEGFLEGGELSTANYDNLLIRWADLDLENDIDFHAGSSQYSIGLPKERREYIKDTYGWTINDGGETGEYGASTILIIDTPEEFSFKVDGARDFVIDWGEGGGFEGPYNGDELLSNTYASPDEYTVRIGGYVERISFYGDGNGTPEHLRDFITPVSEGIYGIKSSSEIFRGAENITSFTAENFFDDISGNVTDMSKMFKEASSFNQDIGSWDTSNVIYMSEMFKGATDFDQDISDWNVSNVENFDGFLDGGELSTENYDNLLINWAKHDLEDNVTFHAGSSRHTPGYPAYMKRHIETKYNWTITDGGITGEADYTGFVIRTSEENRSFKFKVYGADGFEVNWGGGEGFEGPYNEDEFLSNTYDEAESFYYIKIRGAADRISFYGDGEGTPGLLRNIATSFSTSISGLTSAKRMFRGASNLETFLGENFLDDLSSDITNMEDMFRNASTFNEDISGWDVSNVTNMHSMFRGASYFNADITGWDVENVTDMSHMFQSAMSFEQEIGGWDVGQVESMRSMFFNNIYFNTDISGWDVSNVEDMASMFYNNEYFNSDIGGWDVSNVKTMAAMFTAASSFDKDINDWDVSNVESMLSMFQQAEDFNQDLNDWDVSGVKDMESMFRFAGSFNGDISSWDVSNVENMSRMFWQASSFNQDISGWNTESVTDMSSMFGRARFFNQDIGEWDVSSVENMYNMFFNALRFNQDLGSWDVSNVENMSRMFNVEPLRRNQVSFQGDISGWDVSSVKDMSYMFLHHKYFNQDISQWDVSNVELMHEMFRNASAFNQDISKWNVENVRRFDDFLVDSGFSDENYNKLLIGWSQLELVPNTAFNAGNAKYKLGLPEEKREYLKEEFNWRITDGGTSWFAYPGYGYSRKFYDEEERLIAKISVSSSAYDFSTKTQTAELSEEQEDAVLNADENLTPETSRTELPLMNYSIIDTDGQDAGSAEKRGDISIRLYAPEKLDPVEFQNSKITRLCEESQEWLQKEPYEINAEKRWIEHKTDALSVYTLILYPHKTLEEFNVYPNPFKPGDSIYGEAEGGGIRIAGLPVDANIRIFNVAGELVDEFRNEGLYSHNWKKANNVASGVYIVVVSHEGEIKTRKFSVIR